MVRWSRHYRWCWKSRLVEGNQNGKDEGTLDEKKTDRCLELEDSTSNVEGRLLSSEKGHEDEYLNLP
jgi:hypothetical protein